MSIRSSYIYSLIYRPASDSVSSRFPFLSSSYIRICAPICTPSFSLPPLFFSHPSYPFSVCHGVVRFPFVVAFRSTLGRLHISAMLETPFMPLQEDFHLLPVPLLLGWLHSNLLCLSSPALHGLSSQGSSSSLPPPIARWLSQLLSRGPGVFAPNLGT